MKTAVDQRRTDSKADVGGPPFAAHKSQASFSAQVLMRLPELYPATVGAETAPTTTMLADPLPVTPASPEQPHTATSNRGSSLRSRRERLGHDTSAWLGVSWQVAVGGLLFALSVVAYLVLAGRRTAEEPAAPVGASVAIPADPVPMAVESSVSETIESPVIERQATLGSPRWTAPMPLAPRSPVEPAVDESHDEGIINLQPPQNIENEPTAAPHNWNDRVDHIPSWNPNQDQRRVASRPQSQAADGGPTRFSYPATNPSTYRYPIHADDELYRPLQSEGRGTSVEPTRQPTYPVQPGAARLRNDTDHTPFGAPNERTRPSLY